MVMCVILNSLQSFAAMIRPGPRTPRAVSLWPLTTASPA